MEDWKCKAMYQLNLSSYCPPGAFCAQTITPRPPTILEGGADWKALAYAEVGVLMLNEEYTLHTNNVETRPYAGFSPPLIMDTATHFYPSVFLRTFTLNFLA